MYTYLAAGESPGEHYLVVDHEGVVELRDPDGEMVFRTYIIEWAEHYPGRGAVDPEDFCLAVMSGNRSKDAERLRKDMIGTATVLGLMDG